VKKKSFWGGGGRGGGGGGGGSIKYMFWMIDVSQLSPALPRTIESTLYLIIVYLKLCWLKPH
jgi:hypothetical protein